MPPELQADIFITRQSKSLLRMYADLVRKPDVLGNQILQRISDTYSREDCDAVATFFTLFAEKASKEIPRQLYEALLPLKTASHALKTIRANVSLMNKLGIQTSPSKKLSKLDAMVLEILQTEGKTEFDVTNAAKEFYGAGGMPIVACADGSKGSALAMAYLLTAHEKPQMPEHGKQPIVVAAYKKPGICEHAARILALLDPQAFQTALQDMADGCLGIKGHSKCMFTAYPICRYADETLMAELVKRAPKWPLRYPATTHRRFIPSGRLLCTAIPARPCFERINLEIWKFIPKFVVQMLIPSETNIFPISGWMHMGAKSMIWAISPLPCGCRRI